jgi:hypothetical protein
MALLEEFLTPLPADRQRQVALHFDRVQPRGPEGLYEKAVELGFPASTTPFPWSRSRATAVATRAGSVHHPLRPTLDERLSCCVVTDRLLSGPVRRYSLHTMCPDGAGSAHHLP